MIYYRFIGYLYILQSVRLLPPEDGDCASEDTRSLATDVSANDDITFPLIDSILSYLDSPVSLQFCHSVLIYYC